MSTTLERLHDEWLVAEAAATRLREKRDREVRQAIESGRESIMGVSRRLGVTRATVYAILKRTGYEG